MYNDQFLQSDTKLKTKQKYEKSTRTTNEMTNSFGHIKHQLKKNIRVPIAMSNTMCHHDSIDLDFSPLYIYGNNFRRKKKYCAFHLPSVKVTKKKYIKVNNAYYVLYESQFDVSFFK